MSNVCGGGLDIGFVDLGYGQVALLGIVQGLTELMPISSSAHMRVVPALLGWRDPGAAFSAALQSAALAAVLTYFWTDVRNLAVRSARAALRGQVRDPNLQMVLWIGIATAPLAIAGLALAPILNTCHSPLRSVTAIGIACLTMAVLLALTEVFARHRRSMEQAGPVDAILVGLAQIGALIPGVSRSGSTLTAALSLGFAREEAVRFSFLLGIPAIALAGGKELWELHKAHLSAHGWSILGVGLVVASASAFVAIWALMKTLERFSTWPFVLYRALLGAVLLAGAAAGLLT